MLACGLGLGGGSGGRAGARRGRARSGAGVAGLGSDIGLDGQERSVVDIVGLVIADLKSIVVSTRQVPGDTPGERTTVGSATCF